MSDAVVQSAQEPIVTPGHKARQPQLCRARALLWKEWREQRLTLVLALSVVLCVALGVRLAGFREPMLAGGFCAIAMGFVLGAAVVGTEGRTTAFLRSSPIPLQAIWLVKTLLGLAVAGVVGLATQWIFETLVGGQRLAHWPSDASALLLCLSCSAFSQYFGWWVKSPISAIGLGVLLAGAFAGLITMNPLQHYLRGHYGPAAALAGLGALLWLGRVWFIRASISVSRTTWRRTVWRFLLPILLIGLLPLGIGAAVLTVDDWCLDPTDARRFDIVGGPARNDRLLLIAEPAFVFHRYLWYGWQRTAPSLVSVSLSDGQAHKLIPHGLGVGRSLGPVSPDERYLVVLRRPRSKREHSQSGGSRWAVVEVCTGLTVADLGRASMVRWFWPSAERMVFYAVGMDRSHRWGTWDARSGEVRSSPDPCSVKWPDIRFCAFLTNPLRLAFYDCDWYEENDRHHVHLLDVDSGKTQAFRLPDSYHFSGLSWDGRFALVSFWAEIRAERESRPPKLVELATGRSLRLRDVLKQVANDGWRETAAFFSGGRRWLFVTPKSMPRRDSSEWHCVDMTTLTAARCRPPAPVGPGVSSPWSSGSAERSYHPAGVLVLLVRLRGDGGKMGCFVIAPRDAPGDCDSFREGDMVAYVRGWRLDDFRWLDEDRLAVCVSTGRKAGVIVANVRTRTVRPLWPADGLGMEWRVVTWDEWKQNAPTN